MPHDTLGLTSRLPPPTPRQTGFAARYEVTKMFPTTALMYVTAYTLAWAYIYMMIFPEPDLPELGSPGGVKASDDGR